MNVENLPWQNGIAAVFATALLAIVCDVAYRKWPREMARTRKVLRQQNALIESFGSANSKDLHAVKEKIEEMNVQIAMLIKRDARRYHPKKTPPKKK